MDQVWLQLLALYAAAKVQICLCSDNVIQMKHKGGDAENQTEACGLGSGLKACAHRDKADINLLTAISTTL